MKKIIIDTDPGVDDALAIMLALKSKKLDVSALTTIYGNSTVENTTRNALTIVEIMRSDSPIYQGASIPLAKSMISAVSQGENGLGGFVLKDLSRSAESENAIEYIIRTLEESASNEVVIVCLGPITNLAIVGASRPDLIDKVAKVVILGGSINEPGNITAVAEFNVFNDPDALKQVLSFDCEKVVIPVNVCRKVVFDDDDFLRINDGELAQQIQTIANLYIEYYKTDPEYGGFAGGVMYDLLAVSYLISPSLFEISSAEIGVVTASGDSNGLTYLIGRGDPNCTLAVDANPSGIKDLFFNTLNMGESKC